jgi:hypothetical protein
MTEHIPTKASEIDVAEAKKYTECSDCEAGLYAYDSREYPGDTGAICFDCLRKRYEALRDAGRHLVYGTSPPSAPGHYWVRFAEDQPLAPMSPWVIHITPSDFDIGSDITKAVPKGLEIAGPIPEPLEPRHS